MSPYASQMRQDMQENDTILLARRHEMVLTSKGIFVVKGSFASWL